MANLKNSENNPSELSLEAVLDMVECSSKFGFKIYKKNLSVIRHCGMLVFLDGQRLFSVDFGPDDLSTIEVVGRYLERNGDPNPKANIRHLTEASESVVRFHKPITGADAYRVQVTGAFVQEFEYYDQSDRNVAKKIICEWVAYDHGDYDLYQNNCRDFCLKCIELAEFWRPLNRLGKVQAKFTLYSTKAADKLYVLPILPVVKIMQLFKGPRQQAIGFYN